MRVCLDGVASSEEYCSHSRARRIELLRGGTSVALETVLLPSITELDSKPYHDSVDASKSKLGHPRLLQHPHDQTDFNCSWIGGNNWPPMRAVVFRDSTLYVTTRRAYVDITSRLER